MNSRVAPRDLERLEAHEAADAVLLVDHEVAGLQVAEVGEEAAQPAAAAARVQVHLLREDVAVGEHREGRLGQLEAARERADAGEHARALADGDPVLAQHVGEPIGTAGVAEEDDRGRARVAQVLGQSAHVALVVWRGPAREHELSFVRAQLAQLDRRRLAEPLEQRLGRDERLLELGRQPVGPALLVLAGTRPEALGLLAHELGLDHHDRGRVQVGPGRDRGTADERHQVDEAVRDEPALERLDEPRQLAARGEALGQQRAQRLQHRACREHVGERERDERVDRAAGALRVGVEEAQALDGVAEELDAHRLVAVAREHVDDAAAPGHLAGGRHRVLALVAALVERLEQDLRRHLVAHAQADDPRLEQVRREAGPQQPVGRGDEGASDARAAPAAVQRRGARRRRRGAAGRETAAGREPAGRGRCPARPASAAERAQVLGELFDVALARHHDEQRRLGEQERDEGARGAARAADRDPARIVEPRAGGGERRQAGDRRQPLRQRAQRGRRRRLTGGGCARRSTRWSGRRAARRGPLDRRRPRPRPGRRSRRAPSPRP